MSGQLELLKWTPPAILGPRDGVTFDDKRDGERLNGQAADVYQFLADHCWHTLREISAATGHPEASISARIRDLRKPHLGNFKVERRHLSKGLHQYRLGDA